MRMIVRCRSMKTFHKISCYTLKLFAIGIFVILFYYAFRYTQVIQPLARELPMDQKDSLPWNGVILLCVLGLFLLLYHMQGKLTEKSEMCLEWGSIAFSMLVVTAFTLWWITCEDRSPHSDQLIVYGAASYFSEGIYDMLSPIGYFAIYPHQLGLAFLMQCLFGIVGPRNHLAYQLLNIVFINGIILFGNWALRLMETKSLTRVFYCISMTLCIPLLTYSHWVYGEIPSIFFMMAAFVFLMKLDQTGRARYGILMVLSIGLTCLYRKNSYIFLIALVIAATIQWITKKQYGRLIWILISIAFPVLLYLGIYAYYESISGTSFDSGIPTSSWIAMGMEDDPELGPGWYNNVLNSYQELGYDAKAMDEISKRKIQERGTYFLKNPFVALDFYKRKVLSQWNEPMYESVFFGSRFADGYQLKSRLFQEIAYGKGYEILFWLADRMQTICMAGVLLYCIMMLHGQTNLIRQVLLITVVGGVLFSVIWEAKARYVFPYYVLMFPLFAMGYESIISWGIQKKKRNSSDKSEAEA